jgi:serine/threonine protein kinase
MPVVIGDIIKRKYRVERALGEGGMGIVVAARHLDLQELYAIKVLKREALGNDVYAEHRFIGEARAAARLKGEHVARVHDIGRLDTGELYMVMEHLKGTDLKNLLHEQGPLPI